MHTFCANACHGTNFLVNLCLANCYAYKHNSTIDEFLGGLNTFMLYSRYLTYLGSNKEGFIRKEV